LTTTPIGVELEVLSPQEHIKAAGRIKQMILSNIITHLYLIITKIKPSRHKQQQVYFLETNGTMGGCTALHLLIENY
jgi:hypothetical protein